jgi:hypothetical protein
VAQIRLKALQSHDLRDPPRHVRAAGQSVAHGALVAT